LANTHSYITYAEKLVEKGLLVTPVENKRPMFKDWQITDGDEVLEKKSLWKKANGLGLIMGKTSGVICLDIDILETTERLKEVRTDLEKLLPPIYCGLSGNPKKPVARLFKYNGERSEKFKFIDAELLCEGNQKVIPPSIHPDTKEPYTWVNKSLYDIDVDDLPDLPENILNYLRDTNEEFRYSTEAKGKSVELTSEKGRCKHGFHNLISARCLRLFHQGYQFEDLVSEALRYDKEVNKDEDDVLYFLCPSRKEFRSKNKMINATRFVAEIIFRNVNKRYDTNNFFKEELANGFTYDDGKRIFRQHISLYNYLKIKSDVWYIPEMKSFQVFDGKKYDIEPEDYIKRFAQKHFKKPSCTSIGDKSTFLDYAKNEQQAKARDFTLKDTGLVNLKNGVLDVKANKLMKHNKKHRMPYLIDVPYICGNDAPIWETLLDLITLSRPHMALAIEEFIGYAISGCDYKVFNKLLILDGGGSNGKSTLIRIIQHLLGEENTSSVSLESINTERFAGFHLVNKLINFCAEEPREAFSNTGAIKKLTGGDSIMVEEKHKGAFQYHNLSKLIISYNKMPFFPDDSLGMRRRIILIPCDQNFEDRPDLKIKDVEARIYRAELPQILFRCLSAYQDVLKRGEFTAVVEGDAKVDQMVLDSNPILEFIKERITLTNNEFDFVKFSKIHASFEDFAGTKTKIGKIKLNKELKRELSKNNAVSYKKTDGWGYHGIVLDSI